MDSWQWLLAVLVVLVVTVVVVGFVVPAVAASVQRRRALRPAEVPEQPVEEPQRPLPAVVVNPTKFDDVDYVRGEATAMFTALGWQEPLWLETTAEDTGLGQAREAVEAGAELVCALGGDGTVRKVATALVNTDIPLGLLPGGTGNLLARNLGLPYTSLADALEVALTGTERAIDVGLATIRLVPEDESGAEARTESGSGVSAAAAQWWNRARNGAQGFLDRSDTAQARSLVRGSSANEDEDDGEEPGVITAHERHDATPQEAGSSGENGSRSLPGSAATPGPGTTGTSASRAADVPASGDCEHPGEKPTGRARSATGPTETATPSEHAHESSQAQHTDPVVLVEQPGGTLAPKPDTARDTSQDHVVEEAFLVMAGLGFDALIMADAPEKLKAQIGPAAYVWAGARHLRGERFTATLQLDDRPARRIKARTVLFANVSDLLAGVELLPAVPDDGELDVMVIAPTSIAGWARVAVHVLTRGRRGTQRVGHTSFSTLTLRTRRPQELQLDGDPIGKSDSVDVHVAKAALKVRVPQPEG